MLGIIKNALLRTLSAVRSGVDGSSDLQEVEPPSKKTPQELLDEREVAREAALVARGAPLSVTHGLTYGPLAVEDPPRLLTAVVVVGQETTATRKFLPDVMLPPEAWEPLCLDAEAHGVTHQHLKELWLRLCAPKDVSMGTIPLKRVVAEFDPRFRRLLRRLLLSRSGGFPRMLFEDFTRWVMEVCAWDHVSLLINTLATVRFFPALTVASVRALTRYFAGEAGLSDLERTALGLLAPDEGLGDSHTPGAWVQLTLRYPILSYPLHAMQASLQKRFFGRKLWRAAHERAGTALFPFDWNAQQALAMTARVMMLETVSLGATPFSFGTPDTETESAGGGGGGGGPDAAGAAATPRHRRRLQEALGSPGPDSMELSSATNKTELTVAESFAEPPDAPDGNDAPSRAPSQRALAAGGGALPLPLHPLPQEPSAQPAASLPGGKPPRPLNAALWSLPAPSHARRASLEAKRLAADAASSSGGVGGSGSSAPVADSAAYDAAYRAGYGAEWESRVAAAQAALVVEAGADWGAEADKRHAAQVRAGDEAAVSLLAPARMLRGPRTDVELHKGGSGGGVIAPPPRPAGRIDALQVFSLLPQPATPGDGDAASTTAALPLMSPESLLAASHTRAAGSPASPSSASPRSPASPPLSPEHDPSIPQKAQEEKLVALSATTKKKRERTREEQLMDSAAENALKLSTQLLFSYGGSHAVATRDISATPRLTARAEGNIFSRSSAGVSDIVPGPRPLGRIGHRLGYATNLSDLAAMLEGVPEAEQIHVANRIVNDAVERGLVEPASLGLGANVTAEEQALALKKWFSLSRDERDSNEQKARMRDNELRAKQEAAAQKRLEAGIVEGAESPTAGGSPTAEAGGASPAASPRSPPQGPPSPQGGGAQLSGAGLGHTMTKREHLIARAAMKTVVDSVARVIEATPQEHQVELLALLARAGGIGIEAMERPRVWTGLDTRVRFAAFAMSELMGNNVRKARAARVAANADKTLPTPVPQRAHAYILAHAPPAGVPRPTLPSDAIARLLLAHVNTGAARAAATVALPCLLCHREIELMPPPVDLDAEELKARQAALKEMGLALDADGKTVVVKPTESSDAGAPAAPRAGGGGGTADGAPPLKKAEGRRAAIARKLAQAMQYTERKAPSGLWVAAPAAAGAEGPLLARGADDGYLKVVPDAPVAPPARVALRASGARGGGPASNTSAKLAALAASRAGDKYVTACVEEVVARRDALLEDERRILEALAKEVGEEAANDGGVVKAMKLDNRASATLAKLEAEFNREDDLEDLAVQIIVAERAITQLTASAAEKAEVAAAREARGRAGALPALAEGDENNVEEDSDRSSYAGSAGFSEGAASAAQVSLRRGRARTGTATRLMTSASGDEGASPSAARSPASPRVGRSLSPSSPGGEEAGSVGGGSASRVGGPPRLRSPSRRSDGARSGGGSAVTAGPGAGAAVDATSPPPPPKEAGAQLSIVDQARKAMEVAPTKEELMRKQAMDEVVYKREEDLAARVSMKRGAKFWGAVALHPFHREAKLNALGKDRKTILALQRSAAIRDSIKEARAAAAAVVQKPPLRPTQKPHTENTGFCCECDRYVRHALADHFGYKVAAVVLKSATAPPAALEEVALHAELAKLEKQPLLKVREPMELATLRQRAEFERAEKAAAIARAGAAAQRSNEAMEYAARADVLAKRLVLKEPAKSTARHVFLDDKWVECFDEESGRLFYYEVVSGRRQWARPPVQSFNVATGAYAAIEPPKLYSLDIEGENQAHVAEMARLDAAASRAIQAIRVVEGRRAGKVPTALTGFTADLGPASAKVVPASHRVLVAEAAAHAEGARLAGARPAGAHSPPPALAAASVRSISSSAGAPTTAAPSARSLPAAPSARSLPAALSARFLPAPSSSVRSIPTPTLSAASVAPPVPVALLPAAAGADASAATPRRLYKGRASANLKRDAVGAPEEAEPAPA
jgi:hypothetical protein